MTEIILYENAFFSEVKDIFFLSSSLKEFSSEEKKSSFFKRWCEDYIIYYPDQFYVMIESDTKKVLGYLSGCENSADSLSRLQVPGLANYKDLFDKYPAHFHINFHPDCRGRGLGGQLVGHYCQVLRAKKIVGVHLVTSTDAKNISFYRKLKFSYEISREFGKMSQLFMGLKLC